MTPAGTMASVLVSNGFIGRYSAKVRGDWERDDMRPRSALAAIRGAILIGLGIAPSTYAAAGPRRQLTAHPSPGERRPWRVGRSRAASREAPL
jgi:hypothetical protein